MRFDRTSWRKSSAGHRLMESSIIGAALGVLLVGIVSPGLLKGMLGFVLIFSALRIFR